MYFSKAQLSRRALGQDRNWELGTNGYRAHEIVWSLFSDRRDRERDFVFRWEIDDGLPLLYVVSERRPEDRDSNFRRLATKKYDPQIVAGQALAFALRANAVVKKRDDDGRQRVHDVVMNAKHELRKDGEWEDSDLTQSELVHSAGADWLVSRASENGFELEASDVLTESHERHEFKKSRNARRVVISTIDFRGRLRVVEPGAFRAALMHGVGPSKAFGCGLLLVRPM